MAQYTYEKEQRNTMAPGDMKIVMRVGGISYEIGHLFAYSLKTSREVVPRQGMGSKTSIGATKGRRSHNGVLIFNVINESIVHELKRSMLESNNPLIKNGSFVSNISNATTFSDQIFDEETDTDGLVGVENDLDAINAMELPPFDLIITSQNPENPNIYSQKKIIGITIMGQQGAIGLDTITAQEQYPFVCKHTTPLATFETKDVMHVNDAANMFLASEGEYRELEIA